VGDPAPRVHRARAVLRPRGAQHRTKTARLPRTAGWTPDRLGRALRHPHGPGYGNDTVNTLRLWSARASNEFNLEVFNAATTAARSKRRRCPRPSPVLYPNDHTAEGRELRLKQQYFFVRVRASTTSCAATAKHQRRCDAAARTRSRSSSTTRTRPSRSPSSCGCCSTASTGWDVAWELTRRGPSRTRTTRSARGAREVAGGAVRALLPRHLEIIYEINHRFLRRGAPARAHGQRAAGAHVADRRGHPRSRCAWRTWRWWAAHSVNGVARLHSELVKTRSARLRALWPERFNNKTNGVTPRRWLRQCNPELASADHAAVGPAGSATWTACEGLGRASRRRRAAGRARRHQARQQGASSRRSPAADHGVEVDPDSSSTSRSSASTSTSASS
jgi:glucan phosphorylase